ncbi:MAG: formylglycine-generating enzyme family protein [Sedimentisphaerales bacterium]
MKKIVALTVIVCVMAIVDVASAELVQGIDIDFVTIGNAGNDADTQIMITDGTSGYGAVNYNYRIGKYEVTNAQWNAFTAAVGAPTGNDGGYSYPPPIGDQQPTHNVSWYETLQFCNYLTSGDKSQGAYLFSGNNTNPGDFLGVDRAAAQTTYSTIYVIPTENEWYKAAYFKPDGNGYSLYANGTDTAPEAGVQSNYNSAIGATWNINNGIQEQNGTFDMMGNVWEWNETIIGPYRGLRGGAYYCYAIDGTLASSYRNALGNPGFEGCDLGFRIASIPEPCSLLLIGLGGLILRKRQ